MNPLFPSLEYTCPINFTTFNNSRNLTNDTEKSAAIIDISNNGMRIRELSFALRKGSMIKVRVPIKGKKTAIPLLAEVKWIRKQIHLNCYAGFRFFQ